MDRRCFELKSSHDLSRLIWLDTNVWPRLLVARLVPATLDSGMGEEQESASWPNEAVHATGKGLGGVARS